MRIFVCSPLRGDIERNTTIALGLCHEVAMMGHSPFAPHVFCTRFLNENLEADRARGISIGLDFLAVCDELWYHSETGIISSGMKSEIDRALDLGIPVRPFPSASQVW